MGNQGSALQDEPIGMAERNLQHFDHSFKGALHTVSGPVIENVFGTCKGEHRPCTVECKGKSLKVIEEVGITNKNELEIDYETLTGISWDHSQAQVKFDCRLHGAPCFIVLTMDNSIEYEGEMKARLGAYSSIHRRKVPPPSYVGMFAGPTKPKPFQRKRPNLSHLPSGKLPALRDMRDEAMRLHVGSYRPVPAHMASRRLDIALQHIYEGHNTFEARTAGNGGYGYGMDSWGGQLIINEESISFSGQRINFEDIASWDVNDRDHEGMGRSDLTLNLQNDQTVTIAVRYIRDVKHTMEYFWNNYVMNSRLGAEAIKLGSTHGRPIVSLQTLVGEMPPPDRPVGSSEVVDQDGTAVRPGGKMLNRHGSITGKAKEAKLVPLENQRVKHHWHKVVLHQGWLLKQGGVGVGNNKSWIRRYFVLYKTSQGHFLVYYSDFTECPLFTDEKNHRNIVDLAKATFIRPGSNKSDNPDVPPYCFDIVTTEREWTLCAESQDNAQRWLQLLTRAVDEDVAILPDEELIFKVKAKVDPTGSLPSAEYSTSLKVSAQGISVCSPDPNSKDNMEIENFFWVYTDFYKWSLICPDGKLALLLNVFSDPTFTRRYEFVFRTKDAQRLSTAIEYFIEKFMSVMHIRLETVEGAFDEVPATATAIEAAEPSGGGLHGNSMDTGGYAEEYDLLGMDNDTPTARPVSTSSYPSDLFNSSVPSSNTGDFLSGGASSAPTTMPPPVPSLNDEIFGLDPFSAPTGAPGKAPALTPAQIEQHKDWLLAGLINNKGPIYNDGILQIMCFLEFRGSQCRATLQYRNASASDVSQLKINIIDTAGLTRFEVTPVNPALAAAGSGQQVIMMECMRPAPSGPVLHISYSSPAGLREESLPLPMLVMSFNDPMEMPFDSFITRWDSLTSPGQEVVRTFTPATPIDHNTAKEMLKNTLKFGLVESSGQEIYGVATLKTGAKQANGEKISVGSMIRIDVAEGAIRITVRTTYPAASSAIMDSIATLF